MSNKQIAALMAVRAFAGTNTVSADNDFADGVAAANRHVINHIDYLITQVRAGHEVPFVVEHESHWPFQGKVISEPQQADRQRVPDGHVLVPVKPTQEMMDAAMAYVYKHGFTRGAGPGAVYAAMLAAAPQAPAPQPAAWNALTDEDRERAMRSMPDMLGGFLKTWGWLHFAKAIEAICREKNLRVHPAPQPLTVEQIDDLCVQYLGNPGIDCEALCRAIERAHGITKGEAS